MKATIRLKNLVLEVEGQSQKDLFGNLAEVTEVFGEKSCGMCGCENLSFVRRTVDKYTYHELKCDNTDCGAKLSYGQINGPEGKLFPVRKLVDKGPEKGKPNSKKGVYDNDHRGWTKFRGVANDE